MNDKIAAPEIPSPLWHPSLTRGNVKPIVDAWARERKEVISVPFVIQHF